MESFKSEKAIAPAQWLECRADNPPFFFPFGVLAQLGERLICIQEVRSSILLGSTKFEFGKAKFEQCAEVFACKYVASPGAEKAPEQGDRVGSTGG